MDAAQAGLVSSPGVSTARRPNLATHTRPVGDGTSKDPQDQYSSGDDTTHKESRLTNFIPDTGYFLAGAIAGGVSRTATAPLDRLKVYLLVNTKSGTDAAIQAAKSGRPVAALQKAGTPFKDAIKEISRAGGIRGFFAGVNCNMIHE
jgi:solute carrier family 25 phosphate transporter 23/24/25/41